MKLTMRVQPEAEVDLEEAYLWYEAQRTGLGDELVLEVERALDRVGERPAAFRVSHRGLRQAMTHRFPYAIYFRVRQEVVDVVAILHGRRDPERSLENR
ncbi:MAG: type II toxin-antitoxin system RelE/ParE family toxin [Myxococcota bacterium]